MNDDFDNWLAGREREPSAEDEGLSPGTFVGDYRIAARLERGGFADVYRASGNDGEPVAIKMLHKLDDKSRARFAREAEILSRIRHRNIPRLLGFGSFGDRPYMVTEFLVQRELPSTDRKVAAFLRQIMSAAEELHRHGFIHRDIKPSNILARCDGTPVLIDFGLASPISAARRELDRLSVDEDGKNVGVGTPGFSAPEQFNGLPAGKEADVHAIGALVDACYRGNIPRCWKRIYRVATVSNPKARYHTMHELRRAVATRHWRKVLAAVLIAGIAFLCMDAFMGERLVSNSKEETLVLPLGGADTNRPYSMRCQVIYKDSLMARQPSDGHVKTICPGDEELMSWFKDFIAEEYADQSHEAWLDELMDESFSMNVTEKFREYIEERISNMVQEGEQAQLGIEIMAIAVKPEGAFREDLEEARKKALDDAEEDQQE